MKSIRQTINLSKLYEHPSNPRKQLDVTELVESIKEMGLLTAPLVRPWGDGFQIVSGHRRKVALIKLDYVEVDCDVAGMDDEQALKALMTANIQSHSLSELEEAEGIRLMIEQFKWTQERVSKEFGKTKMWVSIRLSLLGLDEKVQESVNARLLTATHGREIAQAPKEMQSAIADKVVKEDLTTRETEQLVKVLKDESISPELKQKAIDTNISPVEIQKESLRTEIRQAVQDARHETIAEHVEAGTVPPVPTDEQLKARKRADKLGELFQDLRDANLLLQPDPKMLPLLIEFRRTAEATNHLDFIIEIANKLKKDIAAALKEHNKPPLKLAGSNVINIKGAKK